MKTPFGSSTHLLNAEDDVAVLKFAVSSCEWEGREGDYVDTWEFPGFPSAQLLKPRSSVAL